VNNGAQPLLRLDEVSAGYKGGAEVLHGVSLAVMSGEIVTLLGANGAGKSTVLRAISGIARVTAGEIAFDGRRITGSKPEQTCRAGIAHVPQGRSCVPFLSVHENIQLGAYTLANDGPGVGEAFEQVYAHFPGLVDRRGVLAGQLSGGQQQMVELARAMMSRPKLLLLDEPSLGLAPKVTEELLDTIRALAHEGTSVLMVEQRVREALSVSERSYVLRVGSVILETSSEELARSGDLRQLYLGTDATV
jgi:branched-chain amino acid transport system ATP-binding protein